MVRDTENKDTKIISICSGKGGAGKTIVSIGIGMLLERQKESQKILLIDFDFQTGGLTHLLQKSSKTLKEIPFSSENLLFGKDEENFSNELEKIREALNLSFETKKADIYFVPASKDILKKTLTEIIGKEYNTINLVQKFKKRISFLREMGFDYIIFDTHAGIDEFNLSLTILSDLVILVHEQDFVSWRTCREFGERIEKNIKDSNIMENNTNILLLPNKVTIRRYEKSAREILQAPNMLQSIKFDNKLFTLYGSDAYNLVRKFLKGTSFSYYLNRNLYRICETIKAEYKPLINVFTFHKHFFQRLTTIFFNPFVTGTIISILFLTVISLTSYNSKIRVTLNKYKYEIALLQGKIHTLKDQLDKTSKELTITKYSEFYGAVGLIDEKRITPESRTSYGVQYILNKNICEINLESDIWLKIGYIPDLGDFIKIYNQKTDLGTACMVVGNFNNPNNPKMILIVSKTTAKELFPEDRLGIIAQMRLMKNVEWKVEKRFRELFYEIYRIRKK